MTRVFNPLTPQTITGPGGTCSVRGCGKQPTRTRHRYDGVCRIEYCDDHDIQATLVFGAAPEPERRAA